MNLSQLMKLKGEWTAFKKRHPKFPAFLRAVYGQALEEGSVIELKVTAPNGASFQSNLKVQAEDLALLRSIFGDNTSPRP